ncbi:uncharacterized protein TNCV_1072761 [Trichonephila clavipes]|nr:uncharacterized protein TNCV_1072761 [Trichonephila clavipes]
MAPQTMNPGVGPVCLGRRQFFLQALQWPPSGQHTTITGTKAEPAFITKHNTSQLYPPTSSSLTPPVLQMAMAWSEWNTCYRAPGSELSLN